MVNLFEEKIAIRVESAIEISAQYQTENICVMAQSSLMQAVYIYSLIRVPCSHEERLSLKWSCSEHEPICWQKFNIPIHGRKLSFIIIPVTLNY